MCQSHVTLNFLGTSDNISLTVQDRHSCSRTLIGNCMWPIAWHHCQCLWMILKVTFAVWNISNSHISWKTSWIY